MTLLGVLCLAIGAGGLVALWFLWPALEEDGLVELMQAQLETRAAIEDLGRRADHAAEEAFHARGSSSGGAAAPKKRVG